MKTISLIFILFSLFLYIKTIKLKVYYDNLGESKNNNKDNIKNNNIQGFTLNLNDISHNGSDMDIFDNHEESEFSFQRVHQLERELLKEEN